MSAIVALVALCTHMLIIGVNIGFIIAWRHPLFLFPIAISSLFSVLHFITVYQRIMEVLP